MVFAGFRGGKAPQAESWLSGKDARRRVAACVNPRSRLRLWPTWS